MIESIILVYVANVCARSLGYGSANASEGTSGARGEGGLYRHMVCGACKQTVSKIHELVKEPSNVIEIQKRAKQISNLIPGPLRLQDGATVDRHLSKALDYIKNSNPDDLCHTFLAC